MRLRVWKLDTQTRGNLQWTSPLEGLGTSHKTRHCPAVLGSGGGLPASTVVETPGLETRHADSGGESSVDITPRRVRDQPQDTPLPRSPWKHGGGAPSASSPAAEFATGPAPRNEAIVRTSTPVELLLEPVRRSAGAEVKGRPPEPHIRAESATPERQADLSGARGRAASQEPAREHENVYRSIFPVAGAAGGKAYWQVRKKEFFTLQGGAELFFDDDHHTVLCTLPKIKPSMLADNGDTLKAWDLDRENDFPLQFEADFGAFTRYYCEDVGKLVDVLKPQTHIPYSADYFNGAIKSRTARDGCPKYVRDLFLSGDDEYMYFNHQLLQLDDNREVHAWVRAGKDPLAKSNALEGNTDQFLLLLERAIVDGLITTNLTLDALGCTEEEVAGVRGVVIIDDSWCAWGTSEFMEFESVWFSGTLLDSVSHAALSARGLLGPNKPSWSAYQKYATAFSVSCLLLQVELNKPGIEVTDFIRDGRNAVEKMKTANFQRRAPTPIKARHEYLVNLLEEYEAFVSVPITRSLLYRLTSLYTDRGSSVSIAEWASRDFASLRARCWTCLASSRAASAFDIISAVRTRMATAIVVSAMSDSAKEAFDRMLQEDLEAFLKMSPKQQTEYTYALQVVMDDDTAYDKLDPRLKSAREIAAAAVRKNAGLTTKLPQVLLNDTTFLLFLIDVKTEVYSYLPPELQHDKEFVLEAIQLDSDVFSKTPFRDDYDVAFAAVDLDPNNFKLCGDAMRNNKDIAEMAVQYNPKLYEYVGPGLKNDEYLAELAIFRDRGPNRLSAAEYYSAIGEELRANKEFAMKFISAFPDEFWRIRDVAGHPLQHDPDLAALAARKKRARSESPSALAEEASSKWPRPAVKVLQPYRSELVFFPIVNRATKMINFSMVPAAEEEVARIRTNLPLHWSREYTNYFEMIQDRRAYASLREEVVMDMIALANRSAPQLEAQCVARENWEFILRTLYYILSSLGLSVFIDCETKDHVGERNPKVLDHYEGADIIIFIFMKHAAACARVIEGGEKHWMHCGFHTEYKSAIPQESELGLVQREWHGSDEHGGRCFMKSIFFVLRAAESLLSTNDIIAENVPIFPESRQLTLYMCLYWMNRQRQRLYAARPQVKRLVPSLYSNFDNSQDRVTVEMLNSASPDDFVIDFQDVCAAELGLSRGDITNILGCVREYHGVALDWKILADDSDLKDHLKKLGRSDPELEDLASKLRSVAQARKNGPVNLLQKMMAGITIYPDAKNALISMVERAGGKRTPTTSIDRKRPWDLGEDSKYTLTVEVNIEGLTDPRSDRFKFDSSATLDRWDGRKNTKQSFDWLKTLSSIDMAASTGKIEFEATLERRRSHTGLELRINDDENLLDRTGKVYGGAKHLTSPGQQEASWGSISSLFCAFDPRVLSLKFNCDLDTLTAIVAVDGTMTATRIMAERSWHAHRAWNLLSPEWFSKIVEAIKAHHNVDAVDKVKLVWYCSSTQRIYMFTVLNKEESPNNTLTFIRHDAADEFFFGDNQRAQGVFKTGMFDTWTSFHILVPDSMGVSAADYLNDHRERMNERGGFFDDDYLEYQEERDVCKLMGPFVDLSA